MPPTIAEGALPGLTAKPHGHRLVRSRHRDRDFTLRRALLTSDMAALSLAMVAALALSPHRASPLADSLWMFLVLPAWAIVFWAYGLYRRPIRRFEPTHLDDAASLCHALLVGSIGLWLIYELAPVRPLSFERLLIFGLLALALVALMRVAVRRVNLRLKGPERVFVAAPLDDVRILSRKLGNHPEYEMELVGAVADEGAAAELGLELSADLEELESLIASRQIDHLLVQLNAAYLTQERLLALMRACYRQGIRFGAFPKVKTLLFPGVEVNHIEGMGMLAYHPPVLSRSARLMKRSMDVALAALLLALCAPLMALVALAIRLDSKGGALYRQTRIGKDGRRFSVVKFRTMIPGADAMTEELMQLSAEPDWLALEDDPRRTRVGRLLRRTSIDELPQLWNVLKGEMSLVGPRPLPECDDESVRGWERHRLDLQPGLTGHWQVLGRNTIPFREMVEIDYAYVAGWSLWQDLKLLLRTVPVVLSNRGAG